MHHRRILNTAVIVGALGYFVDIYDLLLFSIVRVASLKSLSVPDSELLNVGVKLIDSQMLGMLAGGIVWGILGDKKGRVSVLFGSIFLYSVANIANGFVSSIEAYVALRFLAGLGLAGELGAAITLVSEVMTKETRGYGTAVVASVGVCGAVVAAIVGDAFSWRTAYMIGGGLGLCLLILRISMAESGLYESMEKNKNNSAQKIRRGDLLLLLSPLSRFIKYLSCILVGAPIWFVIGILITFSPELSKALEVTGPIAASRSVMFCYIGLALGDLTSGLLSQWLKSRKKVLYLFELMTLLFILIYVNCRGFTPEQFYTLCLALGFAVGYWAVFVTNASEQFGTNLRATVATTAPNFVRGMVPIITYSFQSLKSSMGLTGSAFAVGTGCLFLALIATYSLKEPYGKELNYFEH